MAGLAIAIVHARQQGVRRVASGIAGVVFVYVVPGVEAGRCAFVLAIRRRCRPDGLQRKQHQEEDGNPATHGAEYSLPAAIQA